MCKKDNCPIDFPIDGDKCCCGGTIKLIGVIEYEEYYKCNQCGAEWCYD
jgi:hypothetical protein